MQNIRLYCPDCGEENFGLRLSDKRFNQQYCYECDWEGEPFEPDIINIKSTKKVKTHHTFIGFYYETFDKYGQAVTLSRFYNSESETKEHLEKDVRRGDLIDGGPYTGILWPDYVEVKGTIYN